MAVPPGSAPDRFCAVVAAVWIVIVTDCAAGPGYKLCGAKSYAGPWRQAIGGEYDGKG
jgi:hypothetical protein